MIRIRRHDRRAIARRQIEIRQGDSEMNGYYHPDIELEMEKAKRREFYREVERVALAKELLHRQPGRLRTAFNQVVSLFKRLALKLEKRSEVSVPYAKNPSESAIRPHLPRH
jgi:hypothetical protein